MKQPTIYTLQAADAPQHTGKLLEIMQRLKAEGRISNFTALRLDDDLSGLATTIGDDDMTLTLLTDELEPFKQDIESKLGKLKSQKPSIKVAEIIVDNVRYDNEFITFPTDLKPIRSRVDMDATWKDIEKRLQDMFPLPVVAPKKNYVPYLVAAVLLIGLLAYLFWPVPPPVADFQLQLANGAVNDCPIPCKAILINASKNQKEVVWDFGDGTTSAEENPVHTFDKPGEFTVKLTAKRDEQTVDEKEQLIKVVELVPVAEFSVDKVECEAPCTISFDNQSENADKFKWSFGDGAGSSDANPSHIYSKPGKFTVKLVAQKGKNQAESSKSIRVSKKAEEPVVVKPEDKPGTGSVEKPAFAVTSVRAQVKGGDYTGNCPHTFVISAKIAVNGPGTVVFTWLRSDGVTTPNDTITFGKEGFEVVTTSWQLGAAGRTYTDLWQQVKIIQPKELLSNKAGFSLTCEGEPSTKQKVSPSMKVKDMRTKPIYSY